MNGPSDLLYGLSYNPHTGIISGCSSYRHKYGYIYLRVGRKELLAHRVAWRLYYGVWPARMDHKDRDRSNNRINNLREATKEQNAQNRLFKTRYASKCIYFDPSHPSRKKYRVRVQVDGRRKHIGWYETEEQAKEAAIEAIRASHGEFSSV